MNTRLVALCAAVLAGASYAQVLTVTTTGTVPRVLNPQIAPCSTAPEPYYYQINGQLNRALQPGEEVRLYVSPILLNGGPIFGCQWIKQCNIATVGPNGALSAIGQFGTNDVPRSWFSGAQANVAFAIVNASAPICTANPSTIAIDLSNTSLINIDPSIPSLFDFQIPCRGAVADITGTPSPGQTLTYTLPSPGVVAFGLLSPSGFVFAGCQIYLDLILAPIVVPTDLGGILNIPIPADPSLVGADVTSQGLLITNGQFDTTQPTLVSVR